LLGGAAAAVGHGSDDHIVQVGLGRPAERGGRGLLHDGEVLPGRQEIGEADVGFGLEVLALLLVRLLDALGFVLQFLRPLQQSRITRSHGVTCQVAN
jgi:hypothetical protein